MFGYSTKKLSVRRGELSFFTTYIDGWMAVVVVVVGFILIFCFFVFSWPSFLLFLNLLRYSCCCCCCCSFPYMLYTHMHSCECMHSKHMLAGWLVVMWAERTCILSERFVRRCCSFIWFHHTAPSKQSPLTHLPPPVEIEDTFCENMCQTKKKFL